VEPGVREKARAAIERAFRGNPPVTL